MQSGKSSRVEVHPCMSANTDLSRSPSPRLFAAWHRTASRSALSAEASESENIAHAPVLYYYLVLQSLGSLTGHY